MRRRRDLKTCLSSQGIQATQALLSRVLLNIVGQIGEALKVNFPHGAKNHCLAFPPYFLAYYMDIS